MTKFGPATGSARQAARVERARFRPHAFYAHDAPVVAQNADGCRLEDVGCPSAAWRVTNLSRR